MAANTPRRYASRLLVLSATLSGRPARGRRASAARLSGCSIRAAAVICSDGVRRAAAAAGGNHLYPAAGSCVRRSGICLRATTPRAGHLLGATAARIRGAGTATSTGGNFRAAYAGIPARSGLGASAGIRGSAAAEQRDLQQRPQHGRHQQCDKHRDDYQTERSDADRGAPGPGCCADAARSAGGRACSCGLARAGVAAFGRAEGRHASEPESAGTRRNE